MPQNPMIQPSVSQTTTSANSSRYDDFRKGATGKLYAPMQIAGAAFLGSMMAGLMLMAVNYFRLGHRALALATAILALAAGFGVAVVCLNLPEGFPNALGPAVQLGLMALIAFLMQGDAFRRHEAAGGEKGGLALALLVVATSIAAVIGLVYLLA